VYTSAKTGEGIDDVLEAVIRRIPPPKGDPEAPLKALIIDSWFDNYVGVVMLVRVVDGTLKPKDRIKLMASGALHLTEQVGVFTPKSVLRESLAAGGVGFVIAGIKDLKDAKVGEPSREPIAQPTRRCQGSRKSSPRSSRASTRWNPASTRRCAMRSPSCS
jgi:GTP-binding protein LepA